MDRHPMKFTALPPELQIRVLAFLSSKDRAGLPLVCKAFERLANDPRNSLLWETLDVTVPLERTDEALQSGTRKLLRARGRQTRDLSVHFPTDLEPHWCSVLGATLPPLFPRLKHLALGPPSYFAHSSVDSVCILRNVVRNCRELEGLVVSLGGNEFAESLACVCELTHLTTLTLEHVHLQLYAEELQAALQPMQGLAKLRSLHLTLETEYGRQFDLPACIPAHLLRLESLHLGCSLPLMCETLMSLPGTFTRLQCLTALALEPGAKWENTWPLVSRLQALKRLSVAIDAVMLPPSLNHAAFSTGLTGLTCCTFWDPADVAPQNPAAQDRLALPALQALKLGHPPFGSRLDWGSLTSLRALTCWVQREQPGFDYRAAVGLGWLTCLELRGNVVTDAGILGCSLSGLRSLTLKETSLSTLPALGAQLTALALLGNGSLVFDETLYDTLENMPALRILRLCICKVRFDSPVLKDLSQAFLCALSKRLDACEACVCHDKVLTAARTQP